MPTTTAAATAYPELLSSVASYADYAATLPGLAEYAAGFEFPDTEPTFTEADTEVNTTIRLPDDLSFRRTPTRRLFVDYRSQPDAYRHLNPLPQPGQSVHGIISGRYAMADLIPAMIESAGPIKHLAIATLSFSKQNATDILQLLDDGHITTISLIISYYYKSTSPEIYAMLIPQLRERGMKTLSIRNHCKMLLAKMENGSKYVIEGSANLRSSQNIENFCFTNDGGLYDFNRRWMDTEILNKNDLGKSQ